MNKDKKKEEEAYNLATKYDLSLSLFDTVEWGKKLWGEWGIVCVCAC